MVSNVEVDIVLVVLIVISFFSTPEQNVLEELSHYKSNFHFKNTLACIGLYSKLLGSNCKSRKRVCILNITIIIIIIITAKDVNKNKQIILQQLFIGPE